MRAHSAEALRTTDVESLGRRSHATGRSGMRQVMPTSRHGVADQGAGASLLPRFPRSCLGFASDSATAADRQ